MMRKSFISEVELERVHRLAAARLESHLKCDNHNPPIMPDPLRVDVVGIAGELGFAQVFGLHFDEDAVVNRPEGDDGIDFFTNMGMVDVKATDCQNPVVNLFVFQGKTTADIYVLGRLVGSKVVFLGWATREEVLAQRPEFHNGKGPSHKLASCRLRDMDGLDGLEDMVFYL